MISGDLLVTDLPVPIRKKIKVVGECWIWTGSYAGKKPRPIWQFYTEVNHKMDQAVRMLYEMYVGGIPEKYELDHCICFNGSCVNPSHVEPVTKKENMRRYFAHQFKLATHCKNGHAFAEVGFFSYPTRQGWLQRQCKACCGDRQRKYLATHPRVNGRQPDRDLESDRGMEKIQRDLGGFVGY